MTAIIGGLVALACALLVLGAIVRVAVGDTTLLRIGGMVFGIALLPSVALGLFQLFASQTPGGMTGFGLLFGFTLLALLAWGGFKLWLAKERGSLRRAPQKFTRKRPIFDVDEDDE